MTMHSYLEKPPAISIKIVIAFKHAGEMGYGFPETPVNSGPLPNTVYSIGVDQIMRKEGCNAQIPIFLNEPVRS